MSQGKTSTDVEDPSRHLSFPLTIAFFFLAMLIVMSGYELAKQLLLPQITIWESHIITIFFTSGIAAVILFFLLRSLYREQQRTCEAVLHEREAKDLLRRSEAQYRTYIESVEDSIYTVDRELRYLLINARHLARKGLPPEFYTEKRYGDFHTPEETERFALQVSQVIASKNSVVDEYEQDGRFYLRRLNPVIDPADNSVIAITVTSSDFTERKQAERNLESTNRKLSLMNEIIIHDISNQLTALSSLISLAEEQEKDPVVKKYHFRMEQVSDMIYSQIIFARDYQKIGVGSPQWQNIHTTIQHSRMSLKLPGLTIDPSSRAWDILADPLLEKVFYNLMDNAIRYAGPSPAVRFSCRHEPEGLILACEDNGPGNGSEDKKRLFTRGYGKNTGLGLFLIREILSITGISIRETGEPGHGSRFELVIPPRAFRPAHPPD